MAHEPAVRPMNFAVATLLVAALALGAWAMLRMDTWKEGRTIEDLPPVDPALIQWQQTAAISTGMAEVAALAVGPDGTIYAGGDRCVTAFSPQGEPTGMKIELTAMPTCLAIGGPEHKHPGRIYVGLGDHIEAFQSDGKPVVQWKVPSEKAMLSSLACAEDDVFAADSGTRTVWRFDLDGTVKNRIGDRDMKRRIPGFLITDPKHFDLVLGADNLLHVVNPRALRVEAYTFAGDLEGQWGKSSPEIDGFFGCCNPAHLAVLADGRYVTAEKGIERIKVYSSDGTFQNVVAGRPGMDGPIAALAVDRNDRVFVLDAKTKAVRIFQHRVSKDGTGS